MAVPCRNLLFGTAIYFLSIVQTPPNFMDCLHVDKHINFEPHASFSFIHACYTHTKLVHFQVGKQNLIKTVFLISAWEYPVSPYKLY